MKILVTGATGFIGSNFTQLALRRGHTVAALVSPQSLRLPLRSHERLIVLRGNLEFPPWDDIAKFSADVCLHAAWITTPGIYLNSPQNVQYLEWSKTFLSKTCDTGTTRLVALGSCIEYASSRSPLKEDAPTTNELHLYAKCKNSLRTVLEQMVSDRNISVCWCRIFYPYGVGEPPGKLCTSIIKAIKCGEQVSLNTPDSIRDYIYVSDISSALLTVIESGVTGNINIGTGVGLKIGQIVETAAFVLGRAVSTKYTQNAFVDPIPYVVADSGNIRKLGWLPKYDFYEGIRALSDSVSEAPKR